MNMWDSHYQRRYRRLPAELRPQPAPASPLADPHQCVHGMNEPWIPRCEAKGTHRIPEELTRANYPDGRRSWLVHARWCPEHRPSHAVPVEAS